MIRTLLQLTIGLLALTFTTVPALAQAPGAPASFADLAEQLGPSVVNIYTTQTVKTSRNPHQFFFDNEQMPEMFRRFFDMPSPFNQQMEPPREMKRTSLGSGVIVSADGYIVTNNHVVENADSINVRLTNFEEHDAKIIGRDPKTDLALIKIEAKNGLPFAAFGNSEKLRVGDWVVAIGNPFGFEQTVTAGIVSGKGRSLGSGPYENFIQTDASINPGNSGGPLFNLQGEMVGINTAIYSRNGGNIGIGFAIPANMAQNVIRQLKETGTVTRGWVGVVVQQVTSELAKQFGLERPIGALVGEVAPNGPAAKAGIQPGDVIIRYNGKEISQMSMLPALVSQTPVGEKAEIVLIRKGKQQRLKVTVAKLEEEQLESAVADQYEKKLGLNVQELTPELAKSLGIKETEGVLVAGVEPGSPAFEAGLRQGDVIAEINRQPVTNLAEYGQAMGAAQAEGGVLLLVKSKGRSRFVAIRFN